MNHKLIPHGKYEIQELIKVGELEEAEKFLDATVESLENAADEYRLLFHEIALERIARTGE